VIVYKYRKKPTLELEAYFRRHSNDIVFYEGTIMNPQTLRNVKIESADACIILANRHTKDPDDEDAANIMRAAAVKTYCPRIRIIMQLLKVQSKVRLQCVTSGQTVLIFVHAYLSTVFGCLNTHFNKCTRL
jgi:potassium large conductance calcium-activated channel subfamily M alpha protein 1